MVKVFTFTSTPTQVIRMVAVVKIQKITLTPTCNPTFIQLHVFDTSHNPRGLCSLSPSSTNSLLALPGPRPGHLQLVSWWRSQGWSIDHDEDDRDEDDEVRDGCSLVLAILPVRTWTRWMNDEWSKKKPTYKAFFDDDFDDRDKDDIFKIQTDKCQGGPGNNRRRSTLHCRPRFCSCLYHAQHTGWDLEFLDNVDYHPDNVGYHPRHCYQHHPCNRN